MIALLDSDIIIDFLKGKQDATKKMQSLKENNTNIYTSVMCYQEVMKGFTGREYKEKEGVAEVFFSSITIINYTPAEAKTMLMIESLLGPKGEIIGEFDTMIAATCLNIKATLITRNIKHFRRIPSLNVEAW